MALSTPWPGQEGRDLMANTPPTVGCQPTNIPWEKPTLGCQPTNIPWENEGLKNIWENVPINFLSTIGIYMIY